MIFKSRKDGFEDILSTRSRYFNSTRFHPKIQRPCQGYMRTQFFTPLVIACLLPLYSCSKSESHQASSISDDMGTVDFPVSTNKNARRYLASL